MDNYTICIVLIFLIKIIFVILASTHLYLRMKGKAGTEFPVQKEITIIFTLSDPCTTVKPLMIKQFPFEDMRYTLGQDVIA